MRLIDANVENERLLDFIIQNDSEIQYSIEHKDRTLLEHIVSEYFARQATAYDVNKVVEQLEELREMVPVNRLLDDIIKDKPKELGQLMAYRKAIEIVKSGGIE